jgi:hypothetical protein
MQNAQRNVAIDEPAQGRSGGRLWFATWTALALVVCGLAISNQSYWIDEANTAIKASQPTLAKWWQEMTIMKGSDLQMPFYMVFAWGWEKLVGLNEFALRAGNAPWFLLGLIAMFRAVAAAPRFQKCVALVVLSSPLIWQYLNEARPYAMQIGMSFIVFFSLYRLGLEQKTPCRERYWIIALCLASLVLAASNMLAMLWLGAYLVAAVLSTSLDQLRRLAREYWLYWALTFTLLFALGLYYLWTLKVGGRAATLENATGFNNVLFILYELLGFSGLGPGRLAIRTNGVHSFLPWLTWLAIYAALLLPVLVLGLRQMVASTRQRTLVSWVGAFAVVAAFILAVGVAVGFRVLGRHFLPALPLLLFVLGNGVTVLLNRRGWAGWVIVAAFLGLSLCSSLGLRFSERHAKDDYRGAAVLGREALVHGESVWWSADSAGAEVYHLPVTQKTGNKNAALIVVNPSENFLQSLPQPDLVLASKPDLYDSSGALENYLVHSGFHRTAALSAFTAWQPARDSIRPPAAATP